MKSWNLPSLTRLEGAGIVPVVHSLRTGESVPSISPGNTGNVTLYVCGITPYDATHIGHATTYLAFDLLQRAWRDAGREVTYAQCVTDVDDPLLERAAATGQDWRELATSQIDLYRSDMTHLRVIPPDHYAGAVEMIPDVVQIVEDLFERGAAYRVPVEGSDGLGDVYADLSADPGFGGEANLDRETMLALFAERGGDPERPGKRDPLDPLLWRQAREGEPHWPGGTLGEGRPGWHIECAAIARRFLGVPFDIQGGGADLIFPHHEMSLSHLRVLSGNEHPAWQQLHVGLVSYQGHKMSKSRGNLVFVSALVDAGVDPGAIRLAILANHYRTEWEWTNTLLDEAQDRLNRWRQAARSLREEISLLPGGLVQRMREAIANDLDAPAALAVVDEWAEVVNAGGEADPAVPAACDALLGISLR